MSYSTASVLREKGSPTNGIPMVQHLSPNLYRPMSKQVMSAILGSLLPRKTKEIVFHPIL